MKIELYTDGGCRGNGKITNPLGGIGIVLLVENREPFYHYENLNFNPNTNNKAEIYAIIRGLQIILEQECLTNSFIQNSLIIYSDSNYTIQGITSWIKGWKLNNWVTATRTPVKNKELWIELDNLLNIIKNNCNIEFIKVTGHTGNKWNEKCDELANYAMDMAVIQSYNMEGY